MAGSDSTERNRNSFTREIAGRFGVMPNFFCSAPAATGLIEELWAFAKSAYLDSPLPSVSKERLFVHLSRFCEVRYCIVRHVGFLIGEGRPAGDAAAPPETVEQVIDLLSRPLPDATALDEALSRLEAHEEPAEIPAPRTQAESDLFDALTVMFVEPRRSARARDAVRRAVGAAKFEILTAYLAFVRTAHYWTETHPDLAYETDMAAVIERRPDLARLLLDPSDAERVTAGAALRQALEELQEIKGSLREKDAVLQESEAQYRALFDSIDEGFCVIERIADDPLDFRYLQANPAFAAQSGVDDVVGRTIRQVVPGETENWFETYDRVARTGQPIRFERDLVTQGRVLELYAFPVPGGTGGRVGSSSRTSPSASARRKRCGTARSATDCCSRT